MSLSAVLQPNNIYDLYARSFNGAQGNIGGNLTFALSGAQGDNFAYLASGSETLPAGSILDQIILCSGSTGALTLPNAADVLALIKKPALADSFTFLINNNASGSFTVIDSADSTVAAPGTVSIPTKTSRFFRGVIVDPTGVATPSIVIY